jgi:hypothetical protein
MAIERNEMGVAASAIQAARAAGEVGALSAEDKVPFLGRVGYLGKIDALVRMSTGKNTPEYKEQLKGLLQSYMDAAELAVENEAKRSARSAKKSYPEFWTDEQDVVDNTLMPAYYQGMGTSSSGVVTLRHPKTGDELQIPADSTEAIEYAKTQGYQ